MEHSCPPGKLKKLTVSVNLPPPPPPFQESVFCFDLFCLGGYCISLRFFFTTHLILSLFLFLTMSQILFLTTPQFLFLAIKVICVHNVYVWILMWRWATSAMQVYIHNLISILYIVTLWHELTPQYDYCNSESFKVELWSGWVQANNDLLSFSSRSVFSQAEIHLTQSAFGGSQQKHHCKYNTDDNLLSQSK